MTLTDKVAVVTGGSRGIGFSIASALTSEGAAVVITGRDQSSLDAAVSRLSRGSGRAIASRADVRVAGDASRVMDEAVKAFGGLDILVNNAGVGLFANVADMTIEQWREVIDTNLSGVFYCCHAAIPHLRRRGGGWILNISSLAGKNSFVGAAAYCASKAGLNAFSEALMQEVRYDDIRVSYVMPGSVATEFAGLGRRSLGEGGRGSAGAADWKLTGDDVAQVVRDLIHHPARSLPSRVEIRPSKPQK
jgi:NAD(P)-dependent dehydrogenase (short-subunit alcohol dehydrogenase family)